MKTSRLITGLLSTALLGVAPLAVAQPAQAATENLTTTTTLEVSYGEPTVVHGEKVSITGRVTASDGNSAYKGTVTLYAQSTKDAAPVALATVPAGGYVSFPDIKPKSNTIYQAAYSGYAATTAYEDNYAASTSNGLAVGVQRKVKFTTPGLWLKGKVSPDYKRKKVVLKRLKGKKYVAWRKVKTNKKGTFKVKAPNKSGFKFSASVPGDKHYTAWTDFFQVY
ncbi:Ig-like domain-containing protein [Nocardioides houyundeii]|uniref:Ig-like domain-containing protein n=1 Tax=Nocardioides houyundeii TaxID=2045452 RepID=UPI000DF2A001|nr:Ig-like domain-containing protein [Nocardioides houyundeii]